MVGGLSWRRASHGSIWVDWRWQTQGGEVLRERDGLRQSGMCGELRPLVLILIRWLFWRAEDQPGRTAGGERAS
jgi:hypothetical protein